MFISLKELMKMTLVDSTIGDEQGNDECIIMRIDEGRVLIVNKGEHKIGSCTW